MLSALEHFDVVVFSSRSNQTGGTLAMHAWLKQHAGACWYESPAGPGLEDVRFVTSKPAAFLTIDDRALTFSGDWRFDEMYPTPESLLAFKPWNKR